MTSSDFLKSLIQDVDDLTERTTVNIAHLDLEYLNWRPEKDKWSTAEVYAHLNSYCDHYFPKFEKAIQTSSHLNHSITPNYKSTWLGRYFIRSMSPEKIHKKFKAPQQHNHLNSQISKDVVNVFLENQKQLKTIIQNSNSININKAKVQIEILPFLKLRLGDFLKFFVTHQQRHLVQIMNNEAQRKENG